MTGRPASACLLAGLLLTAGCATPKPRMPMTPASSLTTQAAPAVAPVEPPGPAPRPAEGPPGGAQAVTAPRPPSILEPVSENLTFTTVEGVPRYKIGPDDVLDVLLTTGAAQEKQTVVVRPNGTVTVAFLEARVGGLTPEQAAAEIRRVLAQFFRQVSIEVLVKEYASKKVSVLGAVSGRVGSFALRGRTTLLDLLAEAGGPAPNADLERVRVVRRDGPAVTVNLLRLLEEPVAQSIVLDAGDVVFVPPLGVALPIGAAGESVFVRDERKVFVLGEVRTPGVFPLMPNMRLSQALALAGGPTDVAVLESARIIRGGVNNPQVVEADFRKLLEEGDQLQDLPLQQSDLIVLPRSGIGNWNAFIAKIRPTLEVLTLPLALPVQIRAISR